MLFRSILLVLMLMGPGLASAQFEADDLVVSLHTNHFQPNTTIGTFNGGLTAQYFVHDQWGLNYSIHAGPDYIHMPASILAVALSGLAYIDPDAILILLMIPEGVSYHVPFGPNGSISPFINVLGLDYRPIENEEYVREEWAMSGSAGVRINWVIAERAVVAAFSEYKVLYTQRDPVRGVNAGLSLGYRFQL